MHRVASRLRILLKVLLAGLTLAAAAAAASPVASDAQPPDSAAATTTPPAATTPPEATTAPAATTPEASAAATTTPAKAPTPAERIAAVKASLEKDRAALKQYQWTETTTLSLKGEVKSTTKMLCRYGTDGKVVKVALGDAPEEEKKKRGIRGKVVENKKEEISDYMKKATEAIKTYIPPDPEKLQVAKEAGKVSVTMLDPGKRVRLDFKDYNIPGDNLGIFIDIAANKLLGVAVTTTIEGGKEPVNFAARYDALADGTGYPAKTTLDAKEMSVKVVVENSGHEKKKTTP
jgi:hypothetical protein